DEKDIHPKQKEPVGHRLALAALALGYGKKVDYQGPEFDRMKVEGSKAILSFKNLGRGLVCKGDKLTGFAIAGECTKLDTAVAVIQDDKISLSAPTVEKPVAIRCGWANSPVVNLWNRAGLPASPFRTDTFPGVTK